MKQEIFRDYFHFSKRERSGIVALLCLVAVCLCIPAVWERWRSPAVVADSGFVAAVQAFRQQLAMAEREDSLRRYGGRDLADSYRGYRYGGPDQRGDLAKSYRGYRYGGPDQRGDLADSYRGYRYGSPGQRGDLADSYRGYRYGSSTGQGHLANAYAGYSESVLGKGKDPAYTPSALFAFDPNTLSAAGWQRLGVPARTIQTIQRYLAKGGRFRKKEDLQRVYGLRPELCLRLLPYVQIASDGPDTATVKAGRPAFALRKPAPLNINTADSAAWEALPGIGPALASRIVHFRERLGGFYATAQVAETYGLPDSTFKKIQPYLSLPSVSLKKININQTDEKSLAQHPYIRYKLARLIVRYRSSNGPFSRPEQLRGIPLVDDSIYRKLEYYITL